MAWKVLYSQRSRVATQGQSTLLHEKAIHSFPSLFGFLIVPMLAALVVVMSFLNSAELVDTKMVLILVVSIFVASHYLIRVGRGLF